jgi:Ras-related protein Rab-5C
MTTANAENLPVLKVVVAGDGAVGKTSLIRRYATGKFEQSRVMTIGVDFQTQIVQLGKHRIKLSIWDIAGQERFGSFRGSFYRGARSVGLVYDVTVPETFKRLADWRREILEIAPGVEMLIVGNKIDLPRRVRAAEAKAWATQEGLPYLETSAATGEGVERFFEGLGWLALKRRD